MFFGFTHSGFPVKSSIYKEIEMIKSINSWFICAIGLSSVSLFFNPSLIGIVLLNLIIFGFTAVIYSDELNFLFYLINKFRKIIYIIFGTSCTIDTLSIPAKAQFYVKAEKFFVNSFNSDTTQDMGSVITLIFNVFRALILLYLAIALIGVVDKMRKDDDWQTASRAPLIILVVLTIGDTLSGMIIGDQAGTSPGGATGGTTL